MSEHIYIQVISLAKVMQLKQSVKFLNRKLISHYYIMNPQF